MTDRAIPQKDMWLEAYQFFAYRLFSTESRYAMPGDVVIQIRYGERFYGLFGANSFVVRKHKDGNNRLKHEILMNGDAFIDKDERFILSVLVHQMVHLWQYIFGKPSRGGYHNKEWADKMLEVGLQPVSHDRPGSMTGQRVSHEIVPNGAYADAFDEWIATGGHVPYEANLNAPRNQYKEQKRRSKTKYTCPTCSTNAWAKPETNLVCGDCMEPMAESLRKELENS